MLGPGTISKGLGDLLEGRPYQPYAVVGDYVTDIRPDRDVLRAVGGDVKQGGHAIGRADRNRAFDHHGALLRHIRLQGANIIHGGKQIGQIG